MILILGKMPGAMPSSPREEILDLDPDVSLVICLGGFDPITVTQQFGRAGRDGNRRCSITRAPSC